MAETPMDIIMKHLSAERGRVENNRKLGQFDGAEFNVVDTAIAINEELKKNFRIITPPAPWATDAEAARFGTLTVPENPLDARTLHVGGGSKVTPALKDGNVEISIRVTGNPTLWYMGTNLQPYRLDDETVPNTVGFPSGREAQIALALTDISASRLHKVTK